MDDRRLAGDAVRRCVLVDGTFWTDDEMIRLGRFAQARARHRASAAERPGRHARVARAAARRTTRKILIHINNTNPILDEDSPRARRAAPPRGRGRVGRNGDRAVSGAAWSREEFEQQLRDKGRAYHIHHPFNVMLNTGRASPEQIRGWVANRFYYQISIPIKDAAILANCPDRAVRRNWVQRILDHDGYGDDPGGIESWLRLAEAVGLDARAQSRAWRMCCRACGSPWTRT